MDVNGCYTCFIDRNNNERNKIMTRKQLAFHNEILASIPSVNSIEEAEQFVRMDYIIDENGNEIYASFVKLVDGTLWQMTDWKSFEGAWMEYEALFTDTPDEDEIVVPSKWSFASFIASIIS